MNLEFFHELFRKTKENKVVQDFAKELSDYLEKHEEKEVGSISNREENGLYQVVDFSSNGVFLQNTENNEVFEETNLTKEIRDKIGNDAILRYQNGEYVYEEELTNDFLNSLVDIGEYQTIQEKFIQESNILAISPDTRYHIEEKREDVTVLSYDQGKTIQVPNALIPYFTKEDSVLYYENGEFKKERGKR